VTGEVTFGFAASNPEWDVIELSDVDFLMLTSSSGT
jgi:hypothetical protein